MARLLPILIIGLIVWWVLRVLKKSSAASTQKTAAPDPTLMVICAHCGVHLPTDSALSRQNGTQTKYYCCADHANRPA